MFALRTLFAAFVAVMIAGSAAQSSSSSTGVASSSSSAYSLSSSSGPYVPGVNDSSSSVLLMSSSSSTGAVVPSYLPYGTYQMIYQVELASTSVISLGLNDALARDVAATIANNTAFNTTAEVLYPYIRVAVDAPSTETFTISSAAISSAANTTVNAWILGNVTNVLDVNTEDLAQTFVDAAQDGNVVMTASSFYNARVYPQEVTVVMTPYESSTGGDDGNNGASSSIASASLLIGSVVMAVVLAF